jgi:hypothetical protein
MAEVNSTISSCQIAHDMVGDKFHGSLVSGFEK